MASRLSLFLAELKRRKVYRVGAVYAAVALVLWGAADFAVDALPVDEPSRGVIKSLILLLTLLGFPIALVLAWAYEVRPEEPREVETGAGRVSRPLSAETRKSIVVLPFDNMSPDPGDAYFADGLTEEIITNLSHLRSLRVISRSSAMVFKNTQRDVRTIGRELDVHYVLEGSVRKAGDDLRITAQLIDATSDEHLWAEKYDGVLEDVFGMQEDVSRSIVAQLALRLEPIEDRLLYARPIQDVPAYQCYLRARQQVWDGTPEGLRKAVKDLETALGMVGDNALIFAGLGYVFFQQANLGIEQEEAIKRAEEYAHKALKLNPECAEAEVVLGASAQAFFGDLRKSIKHSERARTLAPNYPDPLLWLSNAYFLVGQMERARPLAELLVQLDPLTVPSHLVRASVHLGDGEVDLAVQSSRRAYDLAPDSPISVWYLNYALAYAGRIEEFQEVKERGLPPDSFLVRMALIMHAAATGERERVLELLSEDMQRTIRRDCEWSYFLSSALAKVGEIDRALEWVDNAVDRGFINHPVLSSNPLLANLKAEPRFQETLKRAKNEWENFEV